MGFKWDDSGPTEKVIRLYTMLMVSRYPLSLVELSQRMNCSKQTILRLINQLEASEFGKVFSERKGREVFYSLEVPQNLSKFSINKEGLIQLALCREFLVKLLPPKMLQSMRQSLEDAVTCLPAATSFPQKNITISLSKGYIDYTPFEDILTKILEAIFGIRVCLVNYKASRTKPEKCYYIAPIRLIFYHESIFVSAFILDEDDKPKFDSPSVLALQRFKSCELTTRKYRLPDIEIEKEHLLGIMEDTPFEVVVRFSPKAATYVAERRWSERQTIIELEDGSIILRVLANNREECIAWILGFREKAVLLEPEWMRNMLHKITLKMCGYYGDCGENSALQR